MCVIFAIIKKQCHSTETASESAAFQRSLPYFTGTLQLKKQGFFFLARQPIVGQGLLIVEAL
jgi:hypothetical protein